MVDDTFVPDYTIVIILDWKLRPIFLCAAIDTV